MNEQRLLQLLKLVQTGSMSTDKAFEELRHLPVEVLDSARLDHHRLLRTGLPEVVFGANKSVEQLLEILGAMQKQQSVILATRISPAKGEQVMAKMTGLTYHDAAGIISGNDEFIPRDTARGTVVIITAGTSDFNVAEEARLCLHSFGHPVATLFDAGVAGLHRILSHSELLQKATVLIVVAGMEGALPTVVAGLSPAPVIAVPSSVGYGTGTGGFSALLGMLNSCAPGLAVVNIDNGFGAACMAAAINRKIKLSE